MTYTSEEEHLLTVLPQPNTLSVVFRDEGCMRFVKFLNCTAPGPRLDFSLVYRDFPLPDSSSSDEEEEQSSQEG